MIFSPVKFALIAISCAVIFMGTAPCFAQEDDGATAEQVAMAYFKTANIKPDFEKWARASDEFKSIAPARVPDFLEKETGRLEKEWKAYNPNENNLKINIPADITLKSTVDKENEIHYLIYITFQQGPIDYFPYVFQEYNFAILPQKLESTLVQPLPKEQLEYLFNQFGESEKGSAMLHIELKPAKAYTSQPFEMDGIEQWVLLADIATMSLTSLKNGSQLWNFGAKWYVSPGTKALQDLYKGSQDKQQQQ